MALTLALSSSAQAATYAVDTLVAAIASANSGQAYEEAQLELVCVCDVTLQSNVDTGAFLIDDAGSKYLDVAPSTPGYFLLKFGTGNSGMDMFFFRNVTDLTKLVWTDALLIAAGLPANHVQSLSHYAITGNVVTTGGTVTPAIPNVPEPLILSLLGIGLSALAYRRKRA
jgi:hypothetical protein